MGGQTDKRRAQYRQEAFTSLIWKTLIQTSDRTWSGQGIKWEGGKGTGRPRVKGKLMFCWMFVLKFFTLLLLAWSQLLRSRKAAKMEKRYWPLPPDEDTVLREAPQSYHMLTEKVENHTLVKITEQEALLFYSSHFIYVLLASLQRRVTLT